MAGTRWYPKATLLIAIELIVSFIITAIGYFIDPRLSFPIITVLLCYLVLSAKLALHFEEEDAFFQKLPLLKSLSESEIDSRMIEVVKNQSKIKSDALKQVHNQVWSDYQENTKQMALSQITGELDYTLYLRLIIERVKVSNKSETIQSVSFLSEGEFNDNPLEREFHKVQIDAKTNGVTVERIFICSDSAFEELKKTKFWTSHEEGRVLSWLLDLSTYESMGLNRRLTEGFVKFHDQVFIDNASNNNWLAGHLSVNEAELLRLDTIFNELKSYSLIISKPTT